MHPRLARVPGNEPVSHLSSGGSHSSYDAEEMTIGENVRARREQLGLSREDVCVRVKGVCWGYSDIARIETTARFPEHATRKRLADALECEPDDFVTGVFPPLEEWVPKANVHRDPVVAQEREASLLRQAMTRERFRGRHPW